MKSSINTNIWLSRIGLGLIFCYCIAASIFFSYFAQIHLTLHFLPFPVFIGEILLFICLVLLAGVSRDGQSFNRWTLLLLGLYFGWVVIRTLINYHYDGPLTARNAALFYYPIFAVFTYCFYPKAKVPRDVWMTLAFLAAGIMFFKMMIVWYWWTYITLFVIALWNIKSVRWRWLGWIFLAAILLSGKENLYQGPRSHFVGVFCAVVFVVFYFGSLLAQRRGYAGLSILLVSFLFFILGFFVFSNRNDVSSVISLEGMINTYNEFDKEYQARQGNFVPEILAVHLYNPKKLRNPFLSLQGETSQPALVASQPAPVTSQPAPAASQPAPVASQPAPAASQPAPVASQPAPAASQPAPVASQPVVASNSTISQRSQPVSVVPPASQEKPVRLGEPSARRVGRQALRKFSLQHWFKNFLCIRNKEGRSLDLDEGNIVFRLFVWRDMARELIQERAWWGFSFGHPQRSRSLEVLHWAQSEWGRDGWITPHNSYFHIIYRAGILGIFLIGALFFMIYRLIRDFFNWNSIEGGFLVGALVYWLVLSNFFNILEFPYNAIVFWSLLGVSMAYHDELKNIDNPKGSYEIKR